MSQDMPTSNPRSLHFAEMLDRAETFSDRERGELADLLRAMTFEGGEAETCIERLTRERDEACNKLSALHEGAGFSDETTTKSQAPIALLTISQGGEVAGVTIYAPGLPPGDHDLYCEPEAVAPMMRDETFDVREANRKLCAAEGHVLSGPVRPCLRCHEWFDPHYGSPLKASGEPT